MTDSAMGPLAPGRLVGDRYEVLRELDDPGGTSRYEALVRPGASGPGVGGGRVWLHVLGAVTDLAVVRRIERGARALRSSRERHLVAVVDVVEHQGHCIAVSEPLTAPSLSQILRDRGVLPTAAAVESATQICGAFTAALQVGVEARAVEASDVFLQGVALVPSESAPTDWDRPELRVLLHRLPPNGATASSADEELGLIGVVGGLLWAMLAGEPACAVDGNSGSGHHDLGALRALRELWDAPPLPGELEAVLAEITAAGSDRRPTSLGSLVTALRAISAGLVEHAEPVAPPDGLVATTPATDREPEVTGPPTEREPMAVALPTDREPLPTEDAPIRTVESPGQGARAGDAARSAAGVAENVGVEGGSAEAEGADIGTTMKSHRDSALELRAAARPAVEVLVREATPESDATRAGGLTPVPSGSRLKAWDDDRAERRLWAIAALLAAAVAIALGIVLGVR